MTELTDWKTIGNNHFINKEFDLAGLSSQLPPCMNDDVCRGRVF